MFTFFVRVCPRRSLVSVNCTVPAPCATGLHPRARTQAPPLGQIRATSAGRRRPRKTPPDRRRRWAPRASQPPGLETARPRRRRNLRGPDPRRQHARPFAIVTRPYQQEWPAALVSLGEFHHSGRARKGRNSAGPRPREAPTQSPQNRLRDGRRLRFNLNTTICRPGVFRVVRQSNKRSGGIEKDGRRFPEFFSQHPLYAGPTRNFRRVFRSAISLRLIRPAGPDWSSGRSRGVNRPDPHDD